MQTNSITLKKTPAEYHLHFKGRAEPTDVTGDLDDALPLGKGDGG